MKLKRNVLAPAIDQNIPALHTEPPCEICGSTTSPCECTTPDWTRQCENCDETPIVPLTGLCGPCTFGEAATAGGNW